MRRLVVFIVAVNAYSMVYYSTGGDLATSHLVWRRGNNVSNVKIAATHLVSLGVY